MSANLMGSLAQLASLKQLDKEQFTDIIKDGLYQSISKRMVDENNLEIITDFNTNTVLVKFDKIVVELDMNLGEISLEEAKEYLLENLSTEEGRSVREVQKEANDFGISKRTLDRAKADLNIKPVKEGFGKGSKWVLKLPKGAKVLDVTDGNL